MASTRRIITLAAGAAIAATLALPAAALATDRYVDNDSMGLPPCTNPAFPCTTIAQATGVPSVTGDVIHVGGGTYAGNLTLPNGVSLIKDSFTSPFDTSGPAIIGAGTDTTPAITLAGGTSPLTVSGFTIRGGNLPTVSTVDSAGATDKVTIAGNTFDAHPSLPPPANTARTDIRLSGGSPRVTGNTFIGNTNDDIRRIGVVYNGTGTNVEIDHNSFDHYMTAMQLNGFGGTAIVNVHDNIATNLYDDSGLASEQGIATNQVSGRFTGNLLTEIAGQATGNGLVLTAVTATGTPLVLSRNRVFGFESDSELAVEDPVVLTDDVFANDGAALFLLSDPSVTATNITATNSTGGFGYDILLSNTALTLNSSVVGSQGVSFSAGDTCTSSFSFRTGGVDTCGFGLVADPLFVNTDPAVNDFQLQPGSPVIDAGDPAAPTEATDLAGNPRAIATLSCPARRDVGAYEFAANPLSCVVPPTTDTTPPETTVSGKRKVKTRKKKARVTFTFSSSESGSSFACSLDGSPFAPCTSPFTRKLRRGAQTLSVRATDPSGNVDPSPGSFTTKVKRLR
jgi:hypothetical protein